MIKFHYHKQPGYLLPGRSSREGSVLCCHVYSDKSREELLAWGQRMRIPAGWLHESSMPHFDIWGGHLRKCKGFLVVGNQQFAGDMRRWRAEHPETEKGAK